MPESNVATLQVNSVTEIQNPDSSILFDVDIMPLDAVLGASPDASFITTQGLQAVVASADDAPGVHDVIAVHKPSYRLVKNRDAIEAVEKSLRVSQLDLRDVQVVDQAAYGGCYMRREYTLPKHSVFIGAEDKVAMKVIVENSYNGTSRFNVHIGAFRYVCSNGLVLGESAFTSNRRHTGQIDLEGMVADMANAIPIFL